MNSADRPNGVPQDHHLNQQNDYYDTSYTSSDFYDAPIPVNSQPPPPKSAQQQHPNQREHENRAIAGSELSHYSDVGGPTQRKESDSEDSQPGFFPRVQNLVANFFDIDASDVQRIASYIFFFFSLVNLLFLILSCALSQVDGLNNACMTFWGYKRNCDSRSYTIDVDLLVCKGERRWMEFGAAFCIIAIIFSAVLCFMSWILCCRVHSRKLKSLRSARNEGHSQSVPFANLGKMRWYIAGTLIGVIVFEFIAWFTIAALRTNGLCVEVLQSMQTYGAGFSLGLCTWALEILFIVAFFLLI